MKLKNDVMPLCESRSLPVKRFGALECSFKGRSQFKEFIGAVHNCFEKEHAELVLVADLSKLSNEVYYLPMYVVHKETSSTSKVRVVLDASAKTASGTSLNDYLLVGPTVHPLIIGILLHFQCHWVAMTTDISRIYRAVLLPKHQRDLHRLVWGRTLNSLSKIIE